MQQTLEQMRLAAAEQAVKPSERRPDPVRDGRIVTRDVNGTSFKATM